jgi:hypothetical protein
MAIVVRPRTRLSSAFWISFSVVVSTDEVASSRIRMRGSISSARAIEMRCRSPPESAWPAFADQRVVAVRQAQDEFVRVRGARGGDDLGARRLGLAVGDVLGDRAEEQEGLLQHQADVLAVFGDRYRTDVHAVDQDRAFGDIVEAADQVDQRALAGTAVADQADHLAGLDDDVDVAGDAARPVAEADAAQFDASRDAAAGAPDGSARERWRRGRECRKCAWRRPLPSASPRRCGSSSRGAGRSG